MKMRLKSNRPCISCIPAALSCLIGMLALSLFGCQQEHHEAASAGAVVHVTSPVVGKDHAAQPGVPTARIRAAANGYVSTHHPEWRQKLLEPMNVVDRQAHWLVHFGKPTEKQLVLEIDKQSFKVLRSSIE